MEPRSSAYLNMPPTYTCFVPLRKVTGPAADLATFSLASSVILKPGRESAGFAPNASGAVTLAPQSSRCYFSLRFLETPVA